MASRTGKDRSYRHHTLNVFAMQRRNTSRVVNKRKTLEDRRQLRARPRDPAEYAMVEFLVDCLNQPETRYSKQFAIGWRPHCEWASGDSITPFAHIFDRFVHGVWVVTVSHDVDGKGQSGWVFTRS